MDLQLKNVALLLKEQKVAFEVTPEARQILARDGYDPEMGARPVARVIDERVLSPLARLMIGEQDLEGRTAKVSVHDDALAVELV